MATLIKKLRFRFDTGTEVKNFECQLSRVELTDEPITEDVQTFCGTDTFSTAAYRLELGGFQDWTDVDGICDIIHVAYIADPVGEIEFEVGLGDPASKFRSGKCKPTRDVSFGGQAGSPLTFEQTLTVVGRPAETALTP
jgi:hypothetical protein